MGRKRQRPWVSSSSSFQTTSERVGPSSCFIWWKALLLLSSWCTTTVATEKQQGANQHHHNNVFIHNNNNIAPNAAELDNAAYTKCAVAMVLNDANRDNQLNEAEFVRFLGRLITNNAVNTIAESFDPSLALSAQADVFQTLFQRALKQQQQDDDRPDATTINVQGARPGTSQDAEQLDFLRDFCAWTYEAIEAWQNPPTAVPTAIPTTTAPTAKPTTASPTITPTLVPTSADTLAPTNSSQMPSETPSELPTTLPTTASVKPSSQVPNPTAVPTSTSTVAPSITPTQVPSSNAPTLPPGTFTMTLYNSFVVGNTQGLKAWDLTLRGEVANLNQGYRAFLNNVATAITAREAPQSSSLATSEIQTTSLYRILNSPCPTWFQSEPGDRLACQSMYGSFDLMISGWVDDSSNDTQAFLENLYSNQTQQAIINGVLQFFVDKQRGDDTTLYLKILGEATSLMAPDTLFPTPGPTTNAPTSSTQAPTMPPVNFTSAPPTRSALSTQAPSRSPSLTQAPTLVSTRTWSAAIYNGFTVAYNITEAPDNGSYPDEYWTMNSTTAIGEDPMWLQDLQNVYRSFVNRTMSQALGDFAPNRSRLRRRRRLAVLGASLESAQIYQVNQGNCHQWPWNDTSIWVCRDVFASFGLLLSNETSPEEIVTLYTNVTQQAIRDGQLQIEVENANTSTSFTIMGLADTNVPGPSDITPTNAPTPTLNDSDALSPTSAPTTGVTNEPTTSTNTVSTIAPTISAPKATAAPTQTRTIPPTDSKPGLPPRSQAPQPDQRNVDPNPVEESSNSNTVAILAVGAAMLLLGCNIGCACCLCFRRKRGRTGATDEGVPSPDAAVKDTLAPSPAPTNAVVLDDQERITLTVADLMEFVDVKSSELIQKIQDLVPIAESARKVDDGEALWSSKKENEDNSAGSDDENPLWPNKADNENNGANKSTSSGDAELWPEEEKNGDDSSESSMDLAEIGLVTSDDQGGSLSSDSQQANREGKLMKGEAQHGGSTDYESEKSDEVAHQGKGGQPDNQQTAESDETEKNRPGRVGSSLDGHKLNQPEDKVDAANEVNRDQSDDQQMEQSDKSTKRVEQEATNEVDGGEPEDQQMEGSNQSAENAEEGGVCDSGLPTDTKSEGSRKNSMSDSPSADSSSPALCADGTAEDGASDRESQDYIVSENSEEAKTQASEEQQENCEAEQTPTLENDDGGGRHSSSSSSDTDDDRTASAAVTEAESQPVPEMESTQSEIEDQKVESASVSESASSESNDSTEIQEAGASPSVKDEPSFSVNDQGDQSDRSSSKENGTGNSTDGSDNGGTEDIDYRERVIQLLEQVMPDEVNNVDVIMEQFEGREEELIETLLRQDTSSSSEYTSDDDGDAPTTDSGGSSSFAAGSSVPTSDDASYTYRDRILHLMEEVMPDEINNVDVVMEQFQGRERELIETLENMVEDGESEADEGSGEDSDGD